MDENQEKILEQIKEKPAKKSGSAATNPLSKTLNSLKKPDLKNIKTLETKKTEQKEEKRATNPISSETSSIVARINNFNTNKTANRMYAGYMNTAANSHRVVDYSDLVYSLNNALEGKTSVHELFTAIHELFMEKLNSVFTAFGIVHEQSKCINIKLFNSMGSTYSSKLLLSDELNPIIQCFNSGTVVTQDNNKFLNIPYLPSSAAYMFPLNSINGCKGVMIVGKDSLENHIGLFSFIADYCALFMQNVELLEQTNKYANTDTLTGLYTHRGFQEVLTVELKKAEENESNLSIIMLDVNNISKINRELGHAKGDEVIKLLAEKVKQNIRSTDKAGRYGGDEIAIILPDTSTADAKYLAEYITYCLSCCFVDDVGPVKVSVGSATYPECSKDQEKLLILAEQAMYIHKFNNEQIVSQNHLMELANSLAGAIDAKDPYTKGHSTSVSRYSEALARAINLPEDEVQRIKLGALLHDVGKIGIPESVLKKPGKLEGDEWEIMKQHPVIGAEKVLAPNDALRDLIPIVKYHHEHIDGSGYPENLKGENIPLAARIVAVADTFHALISDRPYRKGMSVEKACEILKDGAGKLWDSDLVRQFITIAPSLSTSV